MPVVQPCGNNERVQGAVLMLCAPWEYINRDVWDSGHNMIAAGEQHSYQCHVMMMVTMTWDVVWATGCYVVTYQHAHYTPDSLVTGVNCKWVVKQTGSHPCACLGLFAWLCVLVHVSVWFVVVCAASPAGQHHTCCLLMLTSNLFSWFAYIPVLRLEYVSRIPFKFGSNKQ